MLRDLSSSSWSMIAVLSALFGYLLAWFRSKHQLALEVLALRHQIGVLKRQARKPILRAWDRCFWATLRRTWDGWRAVLILWAPETVIGWHRAGFRLFWRWRSGGRVGRPAVDRDVIQLIRRMWAANPTWGSPRIRDELAKLGVHVSTATIRKYRPSSGGRRSQSWRTFLGNHGAAIAAMDFFVVPTATFRLLYVLIVVTHHRRRIVHFSTTESPTAEWTAQQVVNAFPYDRAPKYLLRDRDSIYGDVFVRRVERMGIKQKLIAPRCPWQNPYAERLIGSIRRKCLDRVVVFSEQHLREVLQAYVEYYENVRPHRSLEHDSPIPRAVEPPEQGKVVELPLVGGLHHRYARRAA